MVSWTSPTELRFQSFSQCLFHDLLRQFLDSEPPTITCPQLTIPTFDNKAGTNYSIITLPQATASDNSGLPVTVTTSHSSPLKVFVHHPVEVTYTATDAVGNTNKCKRKFIVKGRLEYEATNFYVVRHHYRYSRVLLVVVHRRYRKIWIFHLLIQNERRFSRILVVNWFGLSSNSRIFFLEIFRSRGTCCHLLPKRTSNHQNRLISTSSVLANATLQRQCGRSQRVSDYSLGGKRNEIPSRKT